MLNNLWKTLKQAKAYTSKLLSVNRRIVNFIGKCRQKKISDNFQWLPWGSKLEAEG